MKWYHCLFLFLIVIIYLGLRLGWQDTIEFGYDQPRLATRIIEFISDGNFLNTQKYAEMSPWGNISWGPALFIFFSPFFLISKNPLTISSLIAIFNIISILMVVYIGRRYVSPFAGLIAGLFLATQPWWIIFSRMVYQPTSVPTFISLGILFTFLTIEKPKTFWLIPLIFTWGFLLQLYFHTFSFVFISLILILFNFRKISLRYTFIGIFITSFLFLPYLNKQTLFDYLPLKNNQNILLVGRDDPLSKIKNITPHYIEIISGGDFYWQLGNGYTDFLKINTRIEKIFKMISLLTIFIIFYNLAMAIKFKEKRVFRISLIIWTIVPVLFLSLIKLANVPSIPRYFLLSLPPLSLLWGITISELIRKNSVFIIFLTIPIWWSIFVLNYYKFIETYTYPNGNLSTYSDVPYSFLKNSLDFIYMDARENGYSNIIIPNDWATGYLRKYVYNETENLKHGSIGSYLINFSSEENYLGYIKIFKSGPYSVYKLPK